MPPYSTNDFVVAYINVFDGPLHERLRNAWRAFAFWREFPLLEVRNPLCIRPDVFLSEVWRQCRRTKARYAVLTEHDFLPCVDRFPVLPREGYAAVCAEHAQRHPDRSVEFTARPAQWYMAFDMEKIQGNLDFEAPRSVYHDPANDLDEYLKKVYGQKLELLEQWDDLSLGLKCKAGHHLFWSRHYNDPPETKVCGFTVEEILDHVESNFIVWLGKLPPEFHRIYTEVCRNETKAVREVVARLCNPERGHREYRFTRGVHGG
jgi:hypothetical protein